MNKQTFFNLRLVINSIQHADLYVKNMLWDQFRQTAKSPVHPKIVILQNNPFIRNLIDKQYPLHAKITNVETPIQQLAEQIQLESVQTYGAILFGFPNSSEQAENLDRLLDGINLAIHFKLSDSLIQKAASNYLSCKSCGKVFNAVLPFIAPTHPGYQNNCTTPAKCSLEVSAQPTDQTNAEVLKYYADKGTLLEYEITEEHLYYDSKEFEEKLNNAVLTHIKI